MRGTAKGVAVTGPGRCPAAQPTLTELSAPTGGAFRSDLLGFRNNTIWPRRGALTRVGGVQLRAGLNYGSIEGYNLTGTKIWEMHVSDIQARATASPDGRTLYIARPGRWECSDD
jgi:hypothetical protein